MSNRLPYPTLMLVTDRHRSAMPLIDAVQAAVSAGVDLIQLREPDLDDEEIERIARELIKRIGPDRILLNGRPELARHLGLGVHLRDGQRIVDAAAPAEGRLVGQSIHGTSSDTSDARPDYLVAGNVFESRTHPDRPGRGVAWLCGVVRTSPLPVLAIGGVTASNVETVLRTGCHGVAVVDAILASHEPGAATVTLRRALDQIVQDRPAADGRTRTEIRDRETAT